MKLRIAEEEAEGRSDDVVSSGYNLRGLCSYTVIDYVDLGYFILV